jgi:anti-sigma B factor antagonist
MSTLAISHSDTPTAVVIRLAGELGINTSQDLERHLTQECARHPRVTVFDLSGLEFMSSLGLGVLVTYRRAAQRWGGRVAVAAARPAIVEVLKRTGLASTLDLRDTVADASEAAARVD